MVFSIASLPYLSTSALFFSPCVRQPAPPIQPPIQAIPSMKFASRTFLFFLRRASLHSSIPSQAMGFRSKPSFSKGQQGGKLALDIERGALIVRVRAAIGIRNGRIVKGAHGYVHIGIHHANLHDVAVAHADDQIDLLQQCTGDGVGAVFSG